MSPLLLASSLLDILSKAVSPVTWTDIKNLKLCCYELVTLVRIELIYNPAVQSSQSLITSSCAICR